jgi:hypothetical protein
VTIGRDHAIADTGATSIFIMDGVDVINKRVATSPLTINLPDGKKVKSSHVCDIAIPGLPTILLGHIVPSLTVASLIGIRPLCKAGCTVVFDDKKCDVVFDGNVILRGFKDPSTDLWTLPIGQNVRTTPGPNILSRPGPCFGRAPHVNDPSASATPAVAVATFTHSVRTRANAIKFAHQSLCSPKISTLLKAVRRGFLKGCPNLSETLILKYLNPSAATAKGHMKRPRHGIRSTRKRLPVDLTDESVTLDPVPVVLPVDAAPQAHHRLPSGPNLIADDEDQSIANIFCYGAFADKHSGIVYHDLTGSFPFMSFDGSVCFFVLFHYESNAILATPIAGLDDMSIFKAYQAYFVQLEQKGFKPKLNVMDNQATKHIKKFLTENDCRLQIVEPHNHRVNAAERAIQTFKAAFIAALATTDSDFPLQLWDRLTPQVEDTLNLLRQSRVDPTKSAYEILNGPYDWNRYPLAPLGCKAVVYEDGDTRGSWASRGIDAFYLGPAKDHYRCDVYYIPETRAYRISGSTELFPQHCQLPSLTQHQHFRALTDELTENADTAGVTLKGRRLLKLLGNRIASILDPPPILDEQRVRLAEQQEAREEEQRVSDVSPIITLPRLTDAPPILLTRNPTAKRDLRATPRLHRRVTRNNIPGVSREANTIDHIPIIPVPTPRHRQRLTTPTRIQPRRGPKATRSAIPSGAQQRIVTRHAINLLTLHEEASFSTLHTPRALMKHAKMPITFEHYASPMVHPVTGRTISSYKKLMHDPATAEVWQTAFGKDFGGMAQGCNKTGQKGTNAMFVMTHDEIMHALAAKKFFTYANPVVDFRPQKDDPHRIRITAGGNLIHYEGNASVRTADIDTAKIHWNSVVSTPNAKYMCLDIKNFYLTAALEYFEYMRIPLDLFPEWTKQQYNLNELAFEGWVHIEMRRAVWGLPQAGILANKRLRRKLAPFGYSESVNTPGLWTHESRPISFTLVVDDFGVKYVTQDDVDHLIASIKSTYTLTEDWTGNLYCGISLDWDYVNRTVDISMPGYIKKKLQEYEHVMPKKLQTCPYSPEPKRFGTEAQAPLPPDSSPQLDKKGIKRVQQIVGSILYYARAVDMTVLMALSSIAVEQTRATEKTMHRCTQLLDYLAGHSDAKVRFHASDMILNIHSDASYLSEAKARSRACGHFFLGWMPRNGEPIRLNGAFHVSTTILRFVVASAAEAELGALYHNCRTGIIFRLTLSDMGHPQPQTPVHCDNATAVGIANNTIKRQRSRSMEMRFFWIGDKIAQEMYNLQWHPGQENLADYQSKHHVGSHHTMVRPWYLHTATSPRVLPRAARPSALKGCVGTLKDGYIRKVPLPRVPRIQYADTCYSAQVPRIPTWSDLTRSLAGLGRSMLRPFSPLLV